MAGFLLKDLSRVGVTAVSTFRDLFRGSGNVGAATVAPICTWLIESPRMSLGNIADESTAVCRGLLDTRDSLFIKRTIHTQAIDKQVQDSELWQGIIPRRAQLPRLSSSFQLPDVLLPLCAAEWNRL
jgi:hypothetical protein